MRKVLYLFLVVLMVMSFLGCSRQESGPVTLRVLFWDQNQAPGIEKVLGEFTAATGIRTRLEITPWGDYWTLLEAAATGGALPDIFVMNTLEIQRYINAGLIMDLTDRIRGSSVANMANFPQDVVSIYSQGGRSYGIPKDIDTIALWYNKRHFDEAGIPYPRDGWTWDDLRSIAQRLSNPAAGRYGFVLSPGETQTGWWNFIYQNDGYVIETPGRTASGFDNPRTIEALEFIVGMIRDGLIPPVEMVAETDAIALMQGGVVSMGMFGSWMLGTFARSDFFLQNTDVVMLPAGPRGRQATIYNGLAWCGFANTNHKEETWKLLEFLSSREAHVRLAEEGTAFSSYQGTADSFFGQFTAWDSAAYLRMMNHSVMRPYSVNTGAWEFPILVQTMNEIFALRTPVREGMLDIANRMNAALAAERR